MRELTTEIKNKIKQIAIDRLQDGNALLVVSQEDINAYASVLEDMYKRSELEIE